MHHKKRLSLAVSAALGLCTLITIPGSVFAQDQQTDEDSMQLQTLEIEETVVTGSRIPRGNLTEPTAVTTITAEDIALTGLTNTAEILRQVPSIGVSGISSGNSNFFTANNGINTLELRNLGEDRTLVLVNGRRYISGVSGSAAVDFNTIPVELIERIEIITGGASAIYGSDALAGVINVILKDHFQGVQTGYQYGEATKGGAKTQTAYLMAGYDFAEDQGNSVVSISYSKDDGLLSRQRSNTQVDDIAECYVLSDDCSKSYEPFYSSFSEGGRFFVPSTGQSFGIASGTGADAVIGAWSTAKYGFNRQQFRRYTVPTERFLLSAQADYNLSDNVATFMETMFAQTRTVSELEPFPHSNSDLNIAGISINNPFMPQSLRDAAIAQGDDVIEYFRRMTEVGQRGASSVRDTFRFVAGLEGEIQDNWQWEAYVDYGRMDDAQQGGGQISVANMRYALDVITDPDTGNYICADSAARAEGCVPINLFGYGSISPDAADYVRAPSSRQQFTQQMVAGATIGGNAAELWAGSLAVAGGFEYRKEKANDVPDVLTQQGLNAGNAQAPSGGQYDVSEVFGEFELPLVEGAAFAQELSIGGAYRYSDYSTVGSTSAYTGRLAWIPIESLRFRVQYARAVRAPNIGELFSPGGENFAPVSDPCDGVTATTPGDTAANCRAVPEIAARIADQGIFKLSQTEIQGTGGFTGKGNENLRPEKSNSWSAGFVWDTDMGRVGAMTLSVDWFDIDIGDFIATVGRQTSVSSCYDATTSDYPNDFCGLVVRDSTGPAFQLGEITEVNSGFINNGGLKTSGIDTAVVWSWEYADWVKSLPGFGSMRLNWTHLLTYDFTQFDETADSIGQVGTPEDKLQAAFIYGLGDWNVQLAWNFLSNSVPLLDDPDFGFDLGSYNVFDLQVGYTFAAGGADARLYAGVNNIFDEKAPGIYSGVPGNTTGTDTDASVYNPIGPTWYAGLTLNF